MAYKKIDMLLSGYEIPYNMVSPGQYAIKSSKYWAIFFYPKSKTVRYYDEKTKEQITISHRTNTEAIKKIKSLLTKRIK